MARAAVSASGDANGGRARRPAVIRRRTGTTQQPYFSGSHPPFPSPSRHAAMPGIVESMEERWLRSRLQIQCPWIGPREDIVVLLSRMRLIPHIQAPSLMDVLVPWFFQPTQA
ncbi:unnamed protein product [Urochloa humidicola]